MLISLQTFSVKTRQHCHRAKHYSRHYSVHIPTILKYRRRLLYAPTSNTIIKILQNATYTGVLCRAVSLHHFSLFVYQKLLRKNPILMILMTKDSRNGQNNDQSMYLREVPLDVTVEREKGFITILLSGIQHSSSVTSISF